MNEIYLAGGCFWCISNVFSSLNGVIDVISGYSGGKEVNPTYEQVKSQTTGHRETIKVIFDENIISLLDILEIYFKNVDPFDYTGQFIDKGHSYTLAIYYLNNNQKDIIEKFLSSKQASLKQKIYIEVSKFSCFYIAEEYHQKYSEKHKEEFEKELIISGRKK